MNKPCETSDPDRCPKDNNRDENAILDEHGFWDYTTPCAGGMEMYQKEDYISLLDDMEAAGMNSLSFSVKWMTTGYKSSLPFMDQLPDNPIIESDNELLRFAIDECKKRKIKIWLMAVVNFFDVALYGGEPNNIMDMTGGRPIPFRYGVYDSDDSMVVERTVQIFEELVTLFPNVDGLVFETETDNVESPRRIPLYNAWAKENGRVEFDQVGRPHDPRFADVADWRDYTTHARLCMMEAVEKAVRARGFEGDLSTICAPYMKKYALLQEMNLAEVHRRCPNWTVIAYWYDKYKSRDAMMEWCVNRPREDGNKVIYLPRGVMTWEETAQWPLPVSLETHWEMDVEDIVRYKPDSVWWFGCGSVNDGIHVDTSLLKQSGYKDGAEARRALLSKVKCLKTR